MEHRGCALQSGTLEEPAFKRARCKHDSPPGPDHLSARGRHAPQLDSRGRPTTTATTLALLTTTTRPLRHAQSYRTVIPRSGPSPAFIHPTSHVHIRSTSLDARFQGMLGVWGCCPSVGRHRCPSVPPTDGGPQRMQTDPPAGVSASPIADNVMTWYVELCWAPRDRPRPRHEQLTG